MYSFNPVNFIIENVRFNGKTGIEALKKFNDHVIIRNDGLFILNKKFEVETVDILSIYENVCNGNIYKELERYCPNGSFLLNITCEENKTPFYTIFATYRCDQNESNQNESNQNESNQNESINTENYRIRLQNFINK